jgi:CHAT domain-containing protein
VIPFSDMAMFRSLLFAALAWACAASDAHAQPDADLKQAELHFQNEKFNEAESLYAKLLNSPNADRQLCYDRLLAIYAKWAVPDRFVRTGLRYRRWLEEQRNPDRLARLAVELGHAYSNLGYMKLAAKEYRSALSGDFAKRLTPAQQFAATAGLAKNSASPEEAKRHWGDVEKQAAERLLKTLTPKELLETHLQAAEANHQLGSADKAGKHLESAIDLQRGSEDWAGLATTYLRRAQMIGLAEADERIERDLRLALESAARGFDLQMMQGDVCAAFAERFALRKNAKESAVWRDKAAERYLAVLRNPAATPGGGADTATAFWKLQQLHQHHRQIVQAMQLAQEQRDSWGSVSHLLEARWKAEHGSLALRQGDLGLAYDGLRDAARLLEDADPINLRVLPTVLLHLGQAEAARSNAVQGERRANQVRGIYKDHSLSSDARLAEAILLSGSCAMQQGELARAMDSFRDGIALCRTLGGSADGSHSMMLLNIALVRQAQGEWKEAIETCLEARSVYARTAEPGELAFAAFDAALANLYLATGDLGKAKERAESVLGFCKKNGVERGPLLVSALHCQALDLFARRQVANAKEKWLIAEKLQEKDRQRSLLARTWNYLGLCAEVQREPEEAETLYRKANQMLRETSASPPATHFISLWRLANVLDRDGRSEEARQMLLDSLAVVEKARLATFGDSRQRASFFAQFGPASDQLVDWSVRDKDWKSALSAMARGRSRALLDQLQLAGVDPRDALPEGSPLRARERELQQAIVALRLQAASLPNDAAEGAAGKKLIESFDRSMNDLTDLRREMFNAHPLYRRMTQPIPPEELADRLKRVLGDESLLLAYWVGKDKSYAMLLGKGLQAPETYELQSDAGLLSNGRVASLPARIEEVLSAHRGIRVKAVKKSAAEPTIVASAKPIPLSAVAARTLVDQFLEQLYDPTFSGVRGIAIRPRDPMSKETPKVHTLGDAVLPPALRRRIAQLDAKAIVVIPDGPLHKLPLETLQLSTSDGVRYAVEELPPLLYAPSHLALLYLADRPAPKDAGSLSLLTLADPAYPQGAKNAKEDSSFQSALKANLPRLEGSAAESLAVQKCFTTRSSSALLREDATEAKFRSLIPGKHVIHLAAHGFADDRFGNLFGALALTPPAKLETTEDDGFLTLQEIFRLPLQDCRIAVLSACQTNVGPQEPLEAGMTLASGFLAAGARQVVASHWSVDDASTAELMSEFFSSLTKSPQDEPYLAATAMKTARLRLLRNPQTSAPFFWGAFTVIGAPEAISLKR